MWVDQRGSEELAMPECLRLLALAAKKGLVGRIALSSTQAPLVHPVNFCYRERSVLVRLGAGTMAERASGALVAFEVDHVDRANGRAWSVLVRGLATPLDEPARSEAMGSAPDPLVLTPGDVVLSIRPDVVTGRRFPLRNGPEHGADRSWRSRVVEAASKVRVSPR
ncbi:MAG TPA: pyridoxamine 5'-phosphate oxidase family protein [Acidimicrobiales bacterium]|nr:pyridoxamine 5'-phosphate oxidase family protein [Acidimicrobiales bacterium]